MDHVHPLHLLYTTYKCPDAGSTRPSMDDAFSRVSGPAIGAGEPRRRRMKIHYHEAGRLHINSIRAQKLAAFALWWLGSQASSRDRSSLIPRSRSAAGVR